MNELCRLCLLNLAICQLYQSLINRSRMQATYYPFIIPSCLWNMGNIYCTCHSTGEIAHNVTLPAELSITVPFSMPKTCRALHSSDNVFIQSQHLGLTNKVLANTSLLLAVRTGGGATGFRLGREHPTPLCSNGGRSFLNGEKCREEDTAREGLQSLRVQGGTIFNIFV